MKIPKPTEADKERFRSIAPDDPRVEVKPMFGNLGAFVNGNMFMGLFGPTTGVRLSDDDAEALRANGGTDDFGPEGRPMKAYVALPEDLSEAEARGWAERAFEYVAAMPPKEPKSRKKG